jgi:hypothetical protein
MKFAFLGGPYTEFRGYVFAYGKPTDVTDGATIAILSTRVDFRKVEDEKVQRQEAAQEVLMQQAIRRPTLKVRR